MDKLHPLFQPESDFRSDLDEFISGEPIEINKYTHFLKGDISGIQDFIFSVKSKGAAKTLKARSFFVQAISENAIALIKKELGEDNVVVQYNGGGNFYLFLKGNDVPSKVEKAKEVINTQLWQKEISFVISLIEIPQNEDDFRPIRKKIEERSRIDKLQKYKHFSKAFEPYESIYNKTEDEKKEKELDRWKEFTKELVKAETWGVKESKNLDDRKSIYVYNKQIDAFQQSYLIGGKGEFEKPFKNSISNSIPIADSEFMKKYAKLKDSYNSKIQEEESGSKEKETGITSNSIIPFEFLGEMAKERTGSAYLGVLKMDIDDLGAVFGSLGDISLNQKVSTAFKWFFEEHLLNVLQKGSLKYRHKDGEKWKDVTDEFYDNTYTVFAGGDDSFFIGSWDVIVQLAAQIQRDFDEFIEYLFSKNTDFKDAIQKMYVGKQLEKKKITLSAGLTIVNSKYPIVRLADEAEELLEKAKNKNALKNKICALGNIISWEEFEYAMELAETLRELILEEGESRALIYQVNQMAMEFDKLMDKTKKKENHEIPKVWKMYYALRNVKYKKNRATIEEKIVKPYSKTMIASFVKGDYSSAAKKYKVAIKLAEYLTKKSV